MTASTLHHRLLQRVFSLRNNQFGYDSLDRPQSVGFDTVLTREGPRRRCRVVMTAHGCKVASCTMCPLPDEAVAPGVEVTTEHWMRQLRFALPPEETADILTLFHNGNFFHDQEVSVARREAVYAWLRTTSVRTLVVESLPQFVTAERIAHATSYLGPDIQIEVALGLQSGDDYLRQRVLASSCSYAGFVAALEVLRAYGHGAQVFLMHQMPFLTTEEASDALLGSVRMLYVEHGIDDPILCPLRVTPGTVAYELHQQKRLRLASLWQLADVLVQIRKDLPRSRARVAVCLLTPSTQDDIHTDACPQCRPELLRWVNAFNVQAEGHFPLRCDCAPAPLTLGCRYDKQAIEGRIKEYLDAA